MMRAPKSPAVTLANWRHLVLHLKIYRREKIASEPRRNKRARSGRTTEAVPKTLSDDFDAMAKKTLVLAPETGGIATERDTTWANVLPAWRRLLRDAPPEQETSRLGCNIRADRLRHSTHSHARYLHNY
jgi:hypothetical protein